MNKWQSISIVVVSICFAGVLTTKMITTKKDSTEMVKAGLEECPKNLGNPNTIWVKDCLAYTELLKKIKVSDDQ